VRRIALVALLLLASATEATAQDWQTFHGDMRRTGSSGSAALFDNAQLWRFETGGYMYSSPAVVEGMVYVGAATHDLLPRREL